MPRDDSPGPYPRNYTSACATCPASALAATSHRSHQLEVTPSAGRGHGRRARARAARDRMEVAALGDDLRRVLATQPPRAPASFYLSRTGRPLGAQGLS